MSFDGGSKSPARENQEDTQNNKAWIGSVFVTPDDAVLPYSFALEKGCSNNTVEYETMITGLWARVTDPAHQSYNNLRWFEPCNWNN